MEGIHLPDEREISFKLLTSVKAGIDSARGSQGRILLKWLIETVVRKLPFVDAQILKEFTSQPQKDRLARRMKLLRSVRSISWVPRTARIAWAGDLSPGIPCLTTGESRLGEEYAWASFAIIAFRELHRTRMIGSGHRSRKRGWRPTMTTTIRQIAGMIGLATLVFPGMSLAHKCHKSGTDTPKPLGCWIWTCTEVQETVYDVEYKEETKR